MIEILHSKLTKKQEKYILGGKYRGRFLGNGATADVVAFGRNKVIRVQERKSSYDPGQVVPWVKYCIRSRSPHVPKIFFAAQEVVDGRVKRLITVIERLQESYTIDVRESDAYYVENYLMRNLWNDDDDYYDSYSERAARAFPVKAMRSMRKTISKHGLYFNDLHDGNWMYRPRDKRLVITDPIC